MNRTGLCNCLAIFDWQDKIDHGQWYDLAVQFFRELGVEPTLGSIGKPSRLPKPISALDTRVRKKKYTKTDDVSVYAMIPKYVQLVFGWYVCADLSIVPGKSTHFCFKDGLGNQSLPMFETVIQHICRLVSPVYGFGYQRPFDKGPDFYAFGMTSGLDYSKEEVKEGDIIAAWSHELMGRNRHLQGMLRDVYPINLISEKHVDRQVDHLSLLDWISKDNTRGTIESVGSNCWLWTIPDESVTRVRHRLDAAGLLICPDIR